MAPLICGDQLILNLVINFHWLLCSNIQSNTACEAGRGSGFMSSDLRLYERPISRRPASTWGRMPVALLFCILFNIACLMIHGFQLGFLLPLRLLPFNASKNLYNEGIRYTKAAFGCLLILTSQWFAPTKFLVSFQTEGKGRFTSDDLKGIVTRSWDGSVLHLNLPTKFVLISNHQVYADWWYAWCLTYFIGPNGVHRNVYITLKNSLKWIPIVGWAMQLYNFIFLARSWASDRVNLASQLSSLGKQAEEKDDPFCFLLYPEGTLVSKETRPISRKFADKNGFSDLTHLLLPRSTGLHYSLRSLVPHIPDLHLIDMTVIYPGVPPLGYGQDYYTLRSIFIHGVPPPVIHIHLRIFDVTDVPIGKFSTESPVPADGQLGSSMMEVDISQAEKDAFDTWLRDLWQEKDTFIGRVSGTGLEKTSYTEGAVEIPLKLRQKREILDAFCFFITAMVTAMVGYTWRKIISTLTA